MKMMGLGVAQQRNVLQNSIFLRWCPWLGPDRWLEFHERHSFVCLVVTGTYSLGILGIFIGYLKNWESFLGIVFHSVGNLIFPTDEAIFFRGVGIPPTRIYWRAFCVSTICFHVFKVWSMWRIPHLHPYAPCMEYLPTLTPQLTQSCR